MGLRSNGRALQRFRSDPQPQVRFRGLRIQQPVFPICIYSAALGESLVRRGVRGSGITIRIEIRAQVFRERTPIALTPSDCRPRRIAGPRFKCGIRRCDRTVSYNVVSGTETSSSFAVCVNARRDFFAWPFGQQARR